MFEGAVQRLFRRSAQLSLEELVEYKVAAPLHALRCS